MEHVINSFIDQTANIDCKGFFDSKVLGILPKLHRKIIGFQINGIGNGHITQAKTLYDILIRHYDIPVVLMYGRSDTNGIYFHESEIIYISVVSTPKSISKLEIIPIVADLFSVKPTIVYEKTHSVNIWVNLFVLDLGNFRTRQLCIASQFSSDYIKIIASLFLSIQMGNITPISILRKSSITSCTLPPLIDTANITIKPVSKRVLCYSVSGEDFPHMLHRIATKYTEYTFYYFLDYHLSYSLPDNVRIQSTSREAFRSSLQSASAVLCTSGNELIQECVFFGIPVASMPCSMMQEEQVENYTYYKNKKWCQSLTGQLDLDNLLKKDVSNQQEEIKKLLDGRESAVLEMIESSC